MKTIKLLATLVALLMNGCYALTGQCAGGGLGPQCTEDGSTYYGDGYTSNNDGSGYDGAPNPDTVVYNDTIGQPKNACDPYKEQVKFLENAGTWKTCLYHKTLALHDLTFKSEVTGDGRCIAIALEDEGASVLCPSVKPGPDNNSFAGTTISGQTSVECTK